MISNLPDLVFLSEPQCYQTDIKQHTSGLQHEYEYHLNSDDLYDRELPLVKSRAIGGTLVLWRKWLDPYVSVFPSQSSSFLPLVLKLPNARISVHIAVYLPTHGKDTEFISELASLKNCIDEICSLHKNPLIFVRGDGNCNAKNLNRMNLLQHFILDYSLTQVAIVHPTYHHFVGDGKFDSNIDVILHTAAEDLSETVTRIICRNDHPEISSHHDVILSEFTLPHQSPTSKSQDCVVAPRITYTRKKVLWTENGAKIYKKAVATQLCELRQSWHNPSSLASTSILMQCTNDIMSLTASATNPSVDLNQKKRVKPVKTPHKIKVAKRRLENKQKLMKKNPSVSSRSQASTAKKNYRQIVRKVRLHQAVKRDKKLDTILTKDPRSIYSYMRSSRKTKTSSIQRLTVKNKVYEGESVADGFFDSMTSLKSCDM